MTSLWLDRNDLPASDEFVPGATFDDLIVVAALRCLRPATSGLSPRETPQGS
jgi:hypothetical protein